MLYLKINENENDNDETTQASESSQESSPSDSKNCTLEYVCNACNNKQSDLHETESCVFSVNFNLDNIKKNAYINKYIYEDVTIPRAEGIKCPNEQCPDQKPEIIYIQYDRENMKYIYICLSCYKANITPHIW